MRLKIDRDDLARLIARAQMTAGKGNMTPMLGCALLAADDDGLAVQSTDTEAAYNGRHACAVEQPGTVATDAAGLFGVVRTLPAGVVSLVDTGGRLEVKAGRSRFRLPTLPAEEYPATPEGEVVSSVALTESALLRAVTATGLSVAQDDGRYGLNGVHVHKLADGVMRWVSTDGHRLSAIDVPHDHALVVPPRMLVPRGALAVIRKIVSDTDDVVTVGFADSYMTLDQGEHRYWFRLLDGEFPDYGAVVPTPGAAHAVTVPAAALKGALKRAGSLLDSRAHAARFALDASGTVSVSVRVERGEVTDAIDADVEGDGLEVGLNIRYLQDILGVVGGDAVRIEVASALSPCLVTAPGTEGATFVVMPMRLA